MLNVRLSARIQLKMQAAFVEICSHGRVIFTALLQKWKCVNCLASCAVVVFLI
jgi:hypothetical protein